MREPRSPLNLMIVRCIEFLVGPYSMPISRHPHGFIRHWKLITFHHPISLWFPHAWKGPGKHIFHKAYTSNISTRFSPWNIYIVKNQVLMTLVNHHSIFLQDANHKNIAEMLVKHDILANYLLTCHGMPPYSILESVSRIIVYVTYTVI